MVRFLNYFAYYLFSLLISPHCGWFSMTHEQVSS